MPSREELRDQEGRTFTEYVRDQIAGGIAASGMTDPQFARASGINYETLRKHGHGETPFSFREVAMVAAALHRHPADVINAAGFIIARDAG